MPANVVVDAGFLAALIDRRDKHHDWAIAKAAELVPPWHTCEAALTEGFYLLRALGTASLIALLRRTQVLVSFELTQNQAPVLALMQKYSDIPMSFADACLVRMTELFPNPLVFTTDADFRIYRRHSRQVIPCVMPK
jgi:uncharacterized protein